MVYNIMLSNSKTLYKKLFYVILLLLYDDFKICFSSDIFSKVVQFYNISVNLIIARKKKLSPMHRCVRKLHILPKVCMFLLMNFTTGWK